MADLYTRKPHTAFESEAMAEQLFSDIQDATHDATDRIKHYTKKIAKLQERINKYRQQLEALLKYKNMSTGAPVFSQVSGNAVYPDGETEDGGTYVTPDDANKTWSLPGMMALREIASQDPVSGDALRNLYDLIKKDTNTLGKLTKRVEMLRNLSASAVSAAEDYVDTYDTAQTRLFDMQKIYTSLSNFRNILAKIPVDFTSEDTVNNFTETMSDNLKLYVDTRSATTNLVTALYESGKYDDKTTQDALKSLLDYLMNTPAQYSTCVADPNKYVLLATEQLSAVEGLIQNAKDALNSLMKDKANPELTNLKNSVISLLKSSVKQSIVETVNKDQRISINKEQISKKDEKVKGFVGTMERLGAAVRAGNQNLDKILNEQPRDLVKKATLASGFPTAATKDGKAALRDHIREYVRAKFGGDIPFCDEVIVYGSNGVKEFVKKSEAVEVSNGVYKKASEVSKEKFLKNYMVVESNIYK